MCGGGDSGSNYYENQDKLFGAQADIATNMYNQYAAHGAPLLQGLSKQAQEGVDPEKYAGLAQSDAQTAAKNAQASSERDAARMGINPSSGAFAQTMADNNLANTANQAGAQNKARADSEKLDWARRSDVSSLYSNMPGQAVNGLNSAGQGYGQMAGAQQKQSNMDQQGYGQMANMAMHSFADGGLVRRDPRDGGQQLAGGGMPQMQDWRTRQTSSQPSSSGPGALMYAPMAAKAVDKLMGNPMGKAIDNALEPAKEAVKAFFNPPPASPVEAPPIVGGPNPAPVVTEVPLAPATTEAVTGATEAVATTEAVAGEALAAAAPELAAAGPAGWAVGAGLGLAGLMMGEFADGGPIKTQGKGLTRKNMIPGGTVKGPGTATSDSIPAWLSNGEFVLNAEAVNMIGEEKLRELNKQGLVKRKRRPVGAMRQSRIS